MIIIEAKRWFQRSYGNTYHSVKVTNTETNETLKSGSHYGYGEHYLQTAAELMKIDCTEFCKQRRERPQDFYITCSDVLRERDLK